MEKRQTKKLTTPKVELQYSKLIEPDEYKGNVDYKTNMILDPRNEEHQALIDTVEDMAQSVYKDNKARLKAMLKNKEDEDGKPIKGKKLNSLKKSYEELELHLPFEDDVDDDGERNGLVIMKAKSSAQGTFGQNHKKAGQTWERKLHYFDAKGQKIEHKKAMKLKLWGGSICRLSLELVPFCALSLGIAGVSLRINAVKIIQLSEGANSSADDFGFGGDDGGFEIDDSFEEDSFDIDDEDDDDDEDDF